MRCRKVKRLLGRYLDGEINSKVSVLIKNHISQCFSCQKELQQLKAVKDFLTNQPKAKASSDFLQKLKIRLAEESSYQPEKEEEIREAGILARRLIPVPLLAMLLLLILFPFRYGNSKILDRYIWENLNGEEIEALNESISSQDLLNELWRND